MAIIKTRYLREISLQESLALLTRQDQSIGYMLLMDKWDDKALICERHPFNLDLPKDDDNQSPYKNNQVRFMPHTGSDMATNGLIAHLNWTLDGVKYNKISRLRVIYAQCDINKLNDHFVYAEIWTSSGVLMAGGTDCSGGGGMTASNILGIVRLLSLTHETEIETTELPYQQAKASQDYFLEKYGYHLI